MSLPPQASTVSCPESPLQPHSALADYSPSADKLKGLLGKFGSKDTPVSASAEDSESSSDDPDAPKVENPFGDVPEEDKAATRAKLEELMRQTNAQSANSTIKLDIKVAGGERSGMTAEEKTEARKR